MRLSLAVIILSLLSFSGIALAVSSLHDQTPLNNTFIPGGTQNFSINVTDSNLNSSSAVLYIISKNAYDRGESWDNHFLTCINASDEWLCKKSISFAIAGSDTIEFFYFEANDTSGNKGSMGNPNSPSVFTLDRNPPSLSFTSPSNNSYIGGNATVSLTVSDSSSGVDSKTVQYSIDSGAWSNLTNTSLSVFKGNFSAASFSNNQTISLRARAADNVGNNASLSINVTVDNEIPRMAFLSSLPGILAGIVQLQLIANDTYSGVDYSNIKYSTGNSSDAFSCSGNIYNASCTTNFDTRQLSDGNYTLTFTVMDKAGNKNSSSLQITTLNTVPVVSILQPSNNAFLREISPIKASVLNTNKIKYVQISVNGNGISMINNMSCDSNFNCDYSLNTTSFTDGGYTIGITAIDITNNATSLRSVSIDNTKPTVKITNPISDIVKADFDIKAEVVDTNLNQNSVSFILGTFKGATVCTPQTQSKYICSTVFNSNQLTDGEYNLTIVATDKAGNAANATKEISIQNQKSITSGSSGNGNQEGKNNNSESQTNGKKQINPISSIFHGTNLAITVALVIAILLVVTVIIAVKFRMNKNIISENQV